MGFAITAEKEKHCAVLLVVLLGRWRECSVSDCVPCVERIAGVDLDIIALPSNSDANTNMVIGSYSNTLSNVSLTT